MVSRLLGMLILLQVLPTAMTPESWMLFQYSRRNWRFFGGLFTVVHKLCMYKLKLMLLTLQHEFAQLGVPSVIAALDEAQALRRFEGFESQAVRCKVLRVLVCCVHV